jgi:SEC-C motif-containing protein
MRARPAGPTMMPSRIRIRANMEHRVRRWPRHTSDGTIHTRLLQLATKGVSRIRERNSRDRQMKLGRDDPCPRGSGKKYKHCCLNAGTAQAAAPTDLTWRRECGNCYSILARISYWRPTVRLQDRFGCR